jgi:hypothetical protein
VVALRRYLPDAAVDCGPADTVSGTDTRKPAGGPLPKPTRRLAILLVVGAAACTPAGQGGSQEAVPSQAPLTGVQICDQYDAPSIPPGYDTNGCWAPTEYFEAAPEVIPSVDVSAPTLLLQASGTAPMGTEGTLYFIRAVSPTARVVLERKWEWPSLEQRIPPGAYQVTIYARTCDANCGSLDPSMLSCTVDVLAEPSMTYTIAYDVSSGIDAGASCRVDR